MKIRKIVMSITLCTVCCIGVQQVSAQRAYVDNGAIVLDCSPGSGFPQGSVETTKGQKVIAPSNTELGGGNRHNGSINATVYQKLELSAADESSASLVGWVAAYAACTDKGAGWRLPTQRESMLIWTMQNKLKALPGYTAYSGVSYWTATESDATFSWSITGNTGTILIRFKTNGNRVRCVKEL